MTSPFCIGARLSQSLSGYQLGERTINKSTNARARKSPQEPQNSSFQFFLLLSCCLFMEFVPSTWPYWLWHGKLSLKRGRSEKALKNLRCKTLLCACSRPKSGMESLWVKWAFSNIKFVMLEESVELFALVRAQSRIHFRKLESYQFL